MNDVLEVKNVFKSYGEKDRKTQVLNDISFSVEREKKVIITGESGSGKTTLLSIISGLDEIDAGEININGTDITKSNEMAKAKFRLRNIGFVFQYHYLLQDFSALGNIMLPLIMQGVKKSEAKERALVMLEKIGLSHRKKHLPSQMSGGECQRTAIARALIHEPLLVLADEPTGALDNKNSENVRDLLSSLVDDQKGTLLVATHDNDFLSIADEHWHFNEGNIEKA